MTIAMRRVRQGMLDVERLLLCLVSVAGGTAERPAGDDLFWEDLTDCCEEPREVD